MSAPRGATAIALTMAVIAVVVLGLVWFGFGTPEERGPVVEPDLSGGGEEYLRSAEELFAAGNFSAARKVARTASEIEPGLLEGYLLAGDASIELRQLDAAVEYFQKVPRDNSLASVKATFGIGRAHFKFGSLTQSEASLRDVLSRRPTHVEANDLLAEVLDIQGRRWESLPYAIELTRQGQASLEAMLLLADEEFLIRPNPRAAAAMKRDPSAELKLGLARSALDDGQRERGLGLLKEVVNENPGLIEAQTLWGEHLLDDNPNAFAAWHNESGKATEGHPRLWFLRGSWSMRNDQPKAAARCFWETLKRNPNHRPAHFQLATALTALKRTGDAKLFLDRGLQLSKLKQILAPVIGAGSDPLVEELTDVVVVLEALGRDLEAQQWEHAARDVAGKFKPFAIEHFEHVTGPAMIDIWVNPDANPARVIDLSDYPVPDIRPPDAAAVFEGESQFVAKFENQARDVGLEFTYVAAPDETTEGKRIVEFTGGGAAALDYDLDNWPDLFFTQGGLFPAKTDGTQPTDTLFRNGGGKGFVDVTQTAGVGGTDFGQGMSVGDFNVDGFPDLFVGNLGVNRFYLNNGDGTFSDATAALQSDRTDWTTSATMADLNADGLPDLYVANYLSGPDIVWKICRINEQDRPRICTPDQFNAAQDRIFLNLGDGLFEDRTETSGIQIPQGKGLGLLAADFMQTGKLQLFVANDGVANFFFSVQNADFVFREQAAALGVSMSGDGLAQACMGIASAYVNQDGYLDFFVTNFDRESNTLYLGADGLFEDASRQSRLREPSLRMLGFGTQAVDGDLDGDADLVVVNGHVDDFSHLGTAYRMRPQYFRNNGRGVFHELAAAEVGSPFATKALGRGMCRLDWNRDGRADLAVSNLDTPASLLTGVSANSGHFLKVKLIGTVTNRDAVGTIACVIDGDWRQTQQQVAGDGYQCSNERVLTFGLGERTSVPVLEIRWLDGSSESFHNIKADQELVVVQGRGGYVVNVD
jgi:tetratricopeptide (TPR) repeat protein